MAKRPEDRVLELEDQVDALRRQLDAKDEHTVAERIADALEERIPPLRDWFAGQVIMGLAACSVDKRNSEDGAEYAYKVADAMLEARK